MKDHYDSSVHPRDLTERLNRIQKSHSEPNDGDCKLLLPSIHSTLLLICHSQPSLDCLDTTEQEPPPLRPRLSHTCPPSARLQPCPLPLVTTRKCPCAVARWHESARRTPRSTEGTSPSQESAAVDGRVMRVNRATRPCQSSSTTGDMRTVGCSTISALLIRSRKDGARFLERAKSNGYDAERERSSLVLGADFRYGSLANVWGQRRGAVRIVTSSSARTSLAFTYHYILIPYSHQHHKKQQSVLPQSSTNRLSPIVVPFCDHSLAAHPCRPLRLVPLSHPASCSCYRVYPSSAPILAIQVPPTCPNMLRMYPILPRCTTFKFSNSFVVAFF